MLPSRSFPHPHKLLLLPKHHTTHTHNPINLYLHHFPVFTRFSSSQQQMILVLSPVHRVPCFFWIGVWFCFRSTRLLPLVQDMALNNGFLGFSGVCRWSLSSPLSPGCRRMSPTRPRVSPLNRRVMHPPAPSTFSCFLPWRILMKLEISSVERLSLGGACFSRTSQDGSHPSSTRFSATCWFLFYVFLGLCFVSLSPCLPLLFWCLGPCDSIHL